MKIKNTVFWTAAISLAAMIQPAQATLTGDLASLVNNGGTLSVGDKTFSGFTYADNGLTSFNAANITVTASVGPDGVYYLTWEGPIVLTRSEANAPAASAHLSLGYTVTANPGQIFMIDQSYTGSAQPSGASLAVDENVFVDGVNVANSHLGIGDMSDFPFPPTGEAGDKLTFNPASLLHITDDISFDIGSGGGLVFISEISQSFHQVPVPEPTTIIAGALLLLPFGTGAVRFFRKKHAA